MALLIPRTMKFIPCVPHAPLLKSISSIIFAGPSALYVRRNSTSAAAAISAEASVSPLSLSSIFEEGPPYVITKRRQGTTGNFSKQVEAEAVDTRASPFAEKAFQGLNLSRSVLQRLAHEGLSVPTDVQVAAIPVILDGHDVAIQSYTGSGKTLAYLLPILSRVGSLSNDAGSSEQNTNKGGIQVVIVVPSRELAIQILRETERILSPPDRKLIQQLIGGANPNRQEEGLKRNKPFLVVGTPGRISELSRAGKLHTHACQFLVLDEADQLLSSKFRDDMRRILEHVGQRRSDEDKDRRISPDAMELPKKERTRVERQTILVSATMPAAVLRAAATWGQSPLLVRANSVSNLESPDSLVSSPNRRVDQVDFNAAEMKGVRESLPPNLEHFYVLSPLHHRVDNLRKCINALGAQSVIVFMNHSRRLKDTEFKLTARGIAAGSLSGDLGKMERASVLAAFRSGKLRVLVVSEVGARGLDVPACDLVVNLELPTDGSHYAHRGGRTGRLGRKGTVVSICEGSEEFVLQKFERQLGINIPRADLSDGKFALGQEATFRKRSSKSASKELATPSL